jgi:hypothetical protein
MTRDELEEKLLNTYTAAYNKKDYGPAARALELLGKLNGHITSGTTKITNNTQVNGGHTLVFSEIAEPSYELKDSKEFKTIERPEAQKAQELSSAGKSGQTEAPNEPNLNASGAALEDPFDDTPFENFLRDYNEHSSEEDVEDADTITQEAASPVDGTPLIAASAEHAEALAKSNALSLPLFSHATLFTDPNRESGITNK